MAKEKENILDLEFRFTDFLDFVNEILDCVENISENEDEDYDDESVEDFKFLLEIYAFYLLGKDAYPNIDLELYEDCIKYNKDIHLLN